jgi:hypothetical protein
VTTGDTEVVQTTGNLHDQIRNACYGQAQDILNNPTAFDSGYHVSHGHAGTGDKVIEERLTHTQRLPFRLFWGCAVSIPAGS